MSVISRAWVPWGNGPTSDPTAKETPAAICFLNLANLVVEHLSFRRSLVLRLAVMGEVVKNRERGNREDAFLFHQPDRLVAQLCCVIDRGYPACAA